jgi:hypothetical protein
MSNEFENLMQFEIIFFSHFLLWFYHSIFYKIKIDFGVIFNFFSISLSRFHDLNHRFCRPFLNGVFFYIKKIYFYLIFEYFLFCIDELYFIKKYIYFESKSIWSSLLLFIELIECRTLMQFHVQILIGFCQMWTARYLTSH